MIAKVPTTASVIGNAAYRKGIGRVRGSGPVEMTENFCSRWKPRVALMEETEEAIRERTGVELEMRGIQSARGVRSCGVLRGEGDECEV